MTHKKDPDIKTFLTKALPRVSKPGRYIGGEVNAPRGEPAPADIRVCLAFPEVYEIGMSHQGMAILLWILNSMDGVFAERAFAVWPDMEAEMRKAGLPLFSLETKSPLAGFDIIGFSLMYELTYTNVVNMLGLARIPLLSAQRNEGHPLVIAGGSCAFNPEPVAEIFDAIVVGDGEEAVVDIIEAYRDLRGAPREKLLDRLAVIPGVYVPRLYEARYVGGSFSGVERPKGGPVTVKKRIVSDLNRAPYPTAPPVPHTKAVHDRVSVEIARGCARGCRFCQAGFVYRPVRERDQETICRLVEEQLSTTGMEEVSLLSLSSGDYSAISSLTARLMESLEQKRVALSVPSLRVDTLSDSMIAEIQKVRKTGFTVAPEAGSARLRAVINKNITEAEIEATVGRVFRAGWRLIKLYFMIGLPTETDEDLDGIISLIQKVERSLPKTGKGGINVSVSTFTPKPHTPFQWEATISTAEMKRRQDRIKRGVRSGRVSVRFHDPRTSLLEAVFSRGDRRLLGVITRACELGCAFDGWTEYFRFDLWERAFAEAGLSMRDCAERAYSEDDALPWDHIETGVKKSYLTGERARAYGAVPTENCMTDACTNCGVCAGAVRNVRAKVDPTVMGQGGRPAPDDDTPAEPNPRLAYVFFYRRTGPACFISHLEIASLVSRALTRVGAPVNFTEGFHPKPRISFAEALAVGVEADGEPFVAELSREVDTTALAEALNATLPQGMEIRSILAPGDCPGKISDRALCPVYEIVVAENGYAALDPASSISSFMESSERWFLGSVNGRAKKINVRPFVEALEYRPEDKTIRLVMKKIGGSSPSPYRVVSAVLGVSEQEAKSFRVVKESTAGPMK